MAKDIIINNFFVKLTHKIFFIVVCLVLIYNSGYVLMVSQDSKAIFFLIPCTAILLIVLFTKYNLFNIKINYFFFSFLLLLFFVICTYVANMEFNSTKLYISIICYLLFSYSIIQLISFDCFVSTYIKCLKYIVIISLLFYIPTNYLGYNHNFPIVTTDHNNYYNAIVFFQFISNTKRNLGVFWEPGLYASFIIIALVFEICFKNKSNLLNLLIFSLGLLSTNSTAGYFLIPLLFILIINKKATKQTEIIIVGLLLFCIMVPFIFWDSIVSFLIEINPTTFAKLQNFNYILPRFNSPILNLKIFLLEPIFGVGFGRATELYISQSFKYIIDAQTSTNSFFLAAMGVPGILYTINWIIGTFGLKNQNMLTRLTIFLIFIIILNKEPHNSLLISYCIMFAFLKEAQTQKKNKRSDDLGE